VDSFYRYITRPDYDEIFNIMSLGHIATSIIFIAVFILIFRRSGDIRRKDVFRKVERLAIFVIIVAQSIYYFWYFVLHAGSDKYPLYMCRIAGIAICLTYFWHWKPLEDFAIMACIYGGITATLFSSPQPYAFPHITRWAYFTMHIGMTYAALLRIIFYHKIIDKKELINAEVLNIIFCVAVFWLDMKYKWNYMFFRHVSPPDMPIIRDLHIPEILNSSPYVTGAVMMFLYAFGTFAAWLFACWMSRKALKIEFEDAIEDASEL
jgi:uncharacterized membrane protein YwaF